MNKTSLQLFLALLGLSIIVSPTDLVAGEFNPDKNIGDEAPAWSELPGVDDKRHSLKDLKDKAAVVLVFTCNSCPYAIDAEDRLLLLNQFCKERNVGLVAINVNKVAGDLPPAMKEKAEEKKFTFPYLFDETQQIAKQYGARYTPEFFVLDGDRKIAYMGSLDDSPDGKAVTKRHVHDAIESVLLGKPPAVTETVPIGCRIRFDRVRRTRKAK